MTIISKNRSVPRRDTTGNGGKHSTSSRTWQPRKPPSSSRKTNPVPWWVASPPGSTPSPALVRSPISPSAVTTAVAVSGENSSNMPSRHFAQPDSKLKPLIGHGDDIELIVEGDRGILGAFIRLNQIPIGHLVQVVEDVRSSPHRRGLRIYLPSRFPDQLGLPLHGRRHSLDRIGAAHGAPTLLEEGHASSGCCYQLPDGTRFLVLASTTHPACEACDRAQLSAEGRVFGCRFARDWQQRCEWR